MVKKSQSEKALAMKPKAKSAKTPKAVTKKPSKPTVLADNKVIYSNLLYGVTSALMIYVFGLWAIDSGSLWVYSFTLLSLYFTIHYFKLFIINKFVKNNEKTRKTR